MKIKRKILVSGALTLSILGVTAPFINSIEGTELQNPKPISERLIRKNTLEEITEISELEKYMPSITLSEGNELFVQGYFLSSSGTNPKMVSESISSEKTKYQIQEIIDGVDKSFVIRSLHSNSVSPEIESGYMVSHQMQDMYVNQNIGDNTIEGYGDRLSVYKYGGKILFIPRSTLTSSQVPGQENWYYDINFPSDGAVGVPIPIGPDFPDTTTLDNWKFAVDMNIQGEVIVDSVDSESDNSITFELKQPKANVSPPEQTTGFSAYLDGELISTQNYDNPGTIEKFTINNDKLDHTKSQEITLDFGQYFDQVKFNTITLDHVTSSLLTANSFSESKINVKVENFINGEGWTAADEFHFMINGDQALPTNIFAIDLIDENGIYNGQIDITGYDPSLEMTIKIKYLDDSGLESFSNEVTLIPGVHIPGTFELGNPFIPGDADTLGKIDLTISGQELLPEITQARIVAQNQDDTSKLPIYSDNFAISSTAEVTHTISGLEHPTTYKFNVEYLDAQGDKVIGVQPSAGLSGDTITTNTMPIPTTYVSSNILDEEVSGNSFNIDGSFIMGSDDEGNPLPSETFILKLNEIVLDDNLLDDDFSNIIDDPNKVEGEFDKSYSGINLEDFSVIPGVETFVTIELNGIEKDSIPITFKSGPHQLDKLTVENITETTADVSFINFSNGTGEQKADNYEIDLYKISDLQTSIFSDSELITDTSSKVYSLDNLDINESYRVRIQFKNGTTNLSSPYYEHFKTKQKLFELDDISVTIPSDTTAKVSYSNLSNGSGSQEATHYSLKLFNLTDLVNPIEDLPSETIDLVNKTHDLVDLVPGNKYKVEIQFKHNSTNLGSVYSKDFEMTQKDFGLTNITVEQDTITETSASVSFNGFEQGTGTQLATDYEIKLFKNSDLLNHTWSETVEITGDALDNNGLTTLESGVDYTVRVQFKNNGTNLHLPESKYEATFKTDETNFAFTGITATNITDSSATITLNGLTQGSSTAETATNYDVIVEGSGQTGTPTNVPLDANNTLPETHSITGLEIGENYTVKISFKNVDGTLLSTEKSTNFDTEQDGFEFTGITATPSSETSSTVVFNGLKQGTGDDQVATSYTVTVETTDKPSREIVVPISGELPSSYEVTNLTPGSDNTISIEFKNDQGGTLATKMSATVTPPFFDVIESQIIDFSTDFNSTNNVLSFNWNYKLGQNELGEPTNPEDIVITIEFPNQQSKKTYTTTATVTDKSFSINLNEIEIDGKKLTSDEIKKGFTVKSTSGLIEFNNGDFTWKFSNTLLSITALSLITVGGYLLIKLINRRRKIVW